MISVIRKLVLVVYALGLALNLAGCSKLISDCRPNCIGVNLSYKNLEGENLGGVNFTRANLSRANLSGANLAGADLRGADLREAVLNGADLRNAKLVGASLQKARLIGADLDGADLSSADLSGAILTRVRLTNVRLNGIVLSDAKLSGADLSGVTMSGSMLNGADLSGANLADANLSGNDLTGANLAGAILAGANLNGSLLTGAYLVGAKMGMAQLTGANLSYALLDGADLRQANLQGAWIERASLAAVSMDKANLSNVYLVGSDLAGSVLTEANLTGAILSGAGYISEASLSKYLMVGSVLTGSIPASVNLNSIIASGARNKRETIPFFRTAQLRGASLNRADLYNAYLAGVSFRGTALKGADWTGAKLKDDVRLGDEIVTKQVNWSGAIIEQSQAASTPSATPAPAQPTPAEYAVLRIGNQQAARSLNPFQVSLSVEYWLAAQVYDTLFEVGLDGGYQPLLAQSYTASQDGKMYTFTLPSNVRFHDGYPLTARDVAFSFNLYRDYKEDARFIEKAQALDDLTLILRLQEPVPDIAAKTIYWWILPQHIWGPLAGDEASLRGFANQPLVGSGPFKLVEFNPAGVVRFAANRAHWLRPPKLDEMIWQTFGDQDAYIRALINGQVDAIDDAPPPTVNTLYSTPNVKVLRGSPVTPSLTDIILNQIDPANCPPQGECVGHPALRDVRVRRALAHATDKQRIIQVSRFGLATPGLTLVPSELTQWHNGEIQDYAFSLATANKILDEAGYGDADNDGVRDMPDGARPLVFNLYYPDNKPQYQYERVAGLLNETWLQIGVRLQIKAVDENALVSMVNPGFKHDIVLWSWEVDPDPDFILSVPTTAQILGEASETGYSNPEYDALYAEQAATFDVARRRQLVWKMQEILMRDVVYIVPMYDQISYAVRTDRFTGWPFGQKVIAPLSPNTLVQVEPIQAVRPTPAMPAPGATPAQPWPAGEAVLRIASQQSVGTLNPFLMSLTMEVGVASLVYDTLFELGIDGAYRPLLAQKFAWSADGTVCTATIPSNVRFHDGVLLTARDVAFSYNLYRDYKQDAAFIEQAQALDDVTVVLTLRQAVPDIAAKTIYLYILPQHIWAPVANDQTQLESFANEPLIGSGPFKLTFRQEDVLYLSANPDHWKRPPKLDGIVWQTFANQDTYLQALIDGRIDAITFAPLPALNTLASIPDIQIVRGTSLTPHLADIIINQIDPKNCPPQGKCSGHPALRDAQVRRALAHATNKEQIIQVTLFNMAKPGLTLVPEGLGKWFNSELKDYTFDPAAANALLDEAGYRDVDKDGVREMPDRTRSLIFTLYYPAGRPKYVYERQAELLGEMWAQIGVDLESQALDEKDLITLVNPGFEHDIVLWSWYVDPDPDFILSVPTTDQILGGSSETGYSNPEYDALYAAQAAALDAQKRQELVWKMQEVLMRDAVYIVPYYDLEAYAVRTDRFAWPGGPKKVLLEHPDNLTAVELKR